MCAGGWQHATISSLIFHNNSFVILPIELDNTRNKWSCKSILYSSPRCNKLIQSFQKMKMTPKQCVSALCLIYVLDACFLYLFMYVARICLTPLPWPSAPFRYALWSADGAAAQQWQIRSSFYIDVFFLSHPECVNMSSVSLMAFLSICIVHLEDIFLFCGNRERIVDTWKIYRWRCVWIP